MPSPMSKRRRISEDGKSSPIKQTAVPSRKPNVLPSFMTPTKASLAKSYPHLVPKSQPRGVPQRTVSPIRQAPRRSIPPETPAEVFGVNGPGVAGRRFMDIENDGEEDNAAPNLDVVEPRDVKIPGKGKAIVSAEKEAHLSNEEEVERQKSVLMRRLRLLRAECENLEIQVDQAKQAQKKAQPNIDATMYFSSSTMALMLDNPYFDQMTRRLPNSQQQNPQNLCCPRPHQRCLRIHFHYSDSSIH